VLALVLWLATGRSTGPECSSSGRCGALLAGLIGGGAAAYGAVLLLLGFRPRDFVARA